MPRCSCSTRALEAIIKDLAGIDLRRQRPRHIFQHPRAISTRPPVRQIETTVHTHPDDGFLPVYLGKSGIQSTTKSAESIKETGSGELRARHEKTEDESDAEWHAEIEILEPGMRERTGHPHEAGTVDNVCLPLTHLEVASSDNISIATPVLHLPAISQHLSQGNTQTRPNGKLRSQKVIASRKLRKARRIEAGTYKAQLPKARRIEAGTYNPAGSSPLTVLDKIEMLEGPSVVMETKETVIKGTAVNFAAKEEDKISRKTRSKASSSAKATMKTKQPNAASPESTSPLHTNTKTNTVKKEAWQIQKAALDRKFAEHGWQPRKRLSPDTLEGIRALHASDPASYSTATLAEHFQITPEAIRRVLKSKWRPNPEEIEDRMKRWENRGLKKWEDMSASGVKPPKRWREMGVQNPALTKKLQSRRRQHPDKGWGSLKQAEDLADRLPFEGSFAERLL